MTRQRLVRLGLATLVLAGVLHVAIVQAIPYVITGVFMRRIETQAGVNHTVRPPLPTDKSRSVVKPSPDLLYAVCVYDVSAGLVHLTITPPETYWSISLFARNTDNFFKLSEGDLKGGTGEVILGRASDAARAKSEFPSVPFVITPAARGVMLARLLVLDQTKLAAVLDAQRSARCEAISNKGQ